MSGNFLYWGSGSPPCWRLMIVLNEKEVKYDQKLLSFANKEHKSEEVLALNPRGQLPTFKYGNVIVNESTAACSFVEEDNRDKGTPLMPTDRAQRALMIQRKEEFLSNLPKISSELAYIYFGRNAPSEEEQEKRLATAKAELKIWDEYVKEGYVAGDSFTLADAIVFPNLALLVRYGLDLASNYPNLDAYYKRVVERKSVKDSWPPHWDDGPGKPLLKDLL